MALGLFVNSSPQTRIWDHLVNVNTGTTLELAPGQQAEVNVPEGFEDPYLVPVRATKGTKGATTTTEAPVAETAKD